MWNFEETITITSHKTTMSYAKLQHGITQQVNNYITNKRLHNEHKYYATPRRPTNLGRIQGQLGRELHDVLQLAAL